VVIKALLVVAGVVFWSFSTIGTGSWLPGLLFAGGAAALAMAFGRTRIGPALVTIGLMALPLHRGRFESLDVWAFVFLAASAAGAALWLRAWPALRWVIASLPFWVLADAHPLFMAAALVLSIGGLAAAAVGPTLPGRTIRRAVVPRPHLANGPLSAVTPAVYHGGHKSRVLSWMTATCAVLAVALAAGGAARDSATLGALGLASAIIALTFAASNWFANRVRLRIDDAGLHSRTLFREQTIPWRDVAGLTIRYVFLPGYNIRIVYYVAFSPTREFAFSSRMHGARELQASIEQATGLTWPTPEVEANF
jgi:hypothetical protein